MLASACAAPKAASEPNASHAAYGKPAGHGASNSAAPAGHSGESRSASPPPGQRRVNGAKPLAGKIVGIDPGHNGRNGTDPAYLAHQVFNGRTMENCNTTGTQTAAGYTESLFNWNVSRYLTADL